MPTLINNVSATIDIRDAFILYRGPSLLDGSPIVVICNRIRAASDNAKTGAMIQTWILRADVSPTEAARDGRDSAICGDCRHRPMNDGTCYVTLFHAPRSVYDAFKRGRYSAVSPELAGEIVRGKMIRIGSYGDPAAVPTRYWQALMRHAAGNTGYTHQWRSCDSALASICMASVDSVSERIEALAMGWRTFRVRTADQPRERGEFVCPASDESSASVDCLTCGACAGNGRAQRGTPVIIAHGGKASRFQAAA